MILQDPMASLNPLFSIYRQVADRPHQGMRGRSLRQRVQNLLRAVRIPRPDADARTSHQMSGGMRQRVVSAIAMAGPDLITPASRRPISTSPFRRSTWVLKDIQQKVASR
jgi:ABC-type glutathione transport system ATPase component